MTASRRLQCIPCMTVWMSNSFFVHYPYPKMWTAFKNHWKLYLMEALGLGIFMISACYFYGTLYSPQGALFGLLPGPGLRQLLMGLSMGATALFIFYSPWTAPSGAQINPAVTISFLFLKRIPWQDALFYILFQFLGGTLAVYLMSFLMGTVLTAPPVSYGITIPGKYGVPAACLMEFGIAFIMISTVLLSSQSSRWKKYTKIWASCLVGMYVMVAGPVSGFGMNPARSFASAFPAGNWTDFWIYLIIPPVSMLSASAFFVAVNRRRKIKKVF